ncbi:LysR family transcriptional regulator [Serratia sp. M24T3]|uniref:LysR family transcriptional regulator n=1 Tax=Serratia sp. M24T3 TaxID=932213 RepID=UPI00025BB22A|nr:LysR family transcriptional regulator [Serratia sp. M24T3]EIC83171.1 LysR family transcriptional regulator [Serratia sp. M24T3]
MISKRLKSFIVTVQEGTIAKAAEKLFTTPPPLSRQIKLLENELGIRLFTRSNAGMRLTDKGSDFYQKTVQAYNLLLSFSEKRNVKKKREIVVNNLPSMHIYSLSDYLSHNSNIISSYTQDSSPDIIISTSPIADNGRVQFVKKISSTMKLVSTNTESGDEDSYKKLPFIQSSHLMKYYGFKNYLHSLEERGFTGGIIINDCFLARVESVLAGRSLAILSKDFFDTSYAKDLNMKIIAGVDFSIGYWIYKSFENINCDDILAYYDKNRFSTLATAD